VLIHPDEGWNDPRRQFKKHKAGDDNFLCLFWLGGFASTETMRVLLNIKNGELNKKIVF